jgi:hypothetical protein
MVSARAVFVPRWLLSPIDRDKERRQKAPLAGAIEL